MPDRGVRLEMTELSLDRGARRLISGLSVAFAGGAHVALRGANGRGKTTLLRAIAGLVRPCGGTITLGVSGVQISAEDRGLHIHLLGHRDGLKAPLDARAHVSFWRGIFGGAGRPEPALERVGLAHIADLPARILSAGQGRRLALARLIACPRPIWLLDEPAAALDSAGKSLLDDLIVEHCHGGGLIIAATHDALGAPVTQTLDLGA
jgi:heme exporter protein A